MREGFDYYYPHLLKHEGGYVNHPRDPGGRTNLGVTQRAWQAWQRRRNPNHIVTEAEMRALKPDTVRAFYRSEYWNAINADFIPPGPDIALFDVCVNSGPGRARQWRPLIEGKEPVEAVKAVCNRRRAFFRSLSTFDVFGKGWMRRVNEVEAQAIKWSLKARGMMSGGELVAEANVSKAKARNAAAGATGTATTPVGLSQVEQAASAPDWLVWGIVACTVVAFGVLVYHAVMQSYRSQAMKDAIDE